MLGPSSMLIIKIGLAHFEDILFRWMPVAGRGKVCPEFHFHHRRKTNFIDNEIHMTAVTVFYISKHSVILARNVISTYF